MKLLELILSRIPKIAKKEISFAPPAAGLKAQRQKGSGEKGAAPSKKLKNKKEKKGGQIFGEGNKELVFRENGKRN